MAAADGGMGWWYHVAMPVWPYRSKNVLAAR